MGFIIKLWSPVIEELFDNVNNPRTKWGDKVLEDRTLNLKIDIRVILDKVIQMHNVEYDVCSGEFSKYDPGNVKYQADRSKVMIEGKNTINQLVNYGVDICDIPVVQICGPELHMLEISLVASGLYVGKKRYSFSLVNRWKNFEILPELVETLLKLKKECMGVADLLNDHLTTIEFKKGSATGPKYQKSNARTINAKKGWTRKNWIVFRDRKYTTSSIPSPPF